MPIASLAMYDLPELHAANDAVWDRIRSELPGAPPELARDRDLHEVWTHPGLLLAQACGYPLVTSLRDRVTLLATPIHTAPGCKGPRTRSAIIVRAGDPATQLAQLQGRRCAVNNADSNSGMNVLRAAIAPLAGGRPFFRAVSLTGAHAASALAVAEDQADTAAIDCVTWAHLQRLRPALTRRLRVIDWTAPTPGLPLITARHTTHAVRATLMRALESVLRDRDDLFLAGIATLPLQAYDTILDLEQAAGAAGYPELC